MMWGRLRHRCQNTSGHGSFSGVLGDLRMYSNRHSRPVRSADRRGLRQSPRRRYGLVRKRGGGTVAARLTPVANAHRFN